MSHNVKTVQRALDAAEDYIKKNLAPNAKRDLDRAKDYITKCPEEDQEALNIRCAALEQQIQVAEEEAAVKRIMTQLERQLRYANEAMDKKNANDVHRYVASAQREIEKLPVHLQEEQQKIVAELEAGADKVEALAKASGIIRQLERDMKDKATLEKLYELVNKLPESLQQEWNDKVESSAKPAKENSDLISPRSIHEAEIVTSGPTIPDNEKEAEVKVDDEADAEPLAPGIARMMDRSMKNIAKYIGRNQFDQAENAMDRARSDTTSKVPDAYQHIYLTQLDTFEGTIKEGKRQQHVETLMKAIERAYDTCKDMLEDTRRHASDLVDKIEYRIEQAMNLIKDDSPLNSNQLEKIKETFNSYRESAAKCVGLYRLKEATSHLERYEKAVEDIQFGDRNDMVDAYACNVSDALQAAPDGPEKEELLARKTEADSKIAAVDALEDKEKSIERLRDNWNSLRVDDGDEGGSMPDYESWKASKSLLIDNTKEKITKYSDFLKSEWVSRCALFEDEVSDVLSEAKSDFERSVKKLSESLTGIVDKAKAELDSGLPLWARKNLHSGLQTMYTVDAEPYLKHDSSEGLLSKASAAVSALIEEIKSNIENEENEVKSKIETATKNASDLWVKMVDQYDSVEMDVLAPLSNIAAWEGKYIKLEGKQNRLGWDFESDGFHFIRKVNGIPIAAKFTDSVKESLKKMEKDFGFERTSQEFDGLVIEIASVGKVVPIQWNHTWNRWDRSPPEDAVVGNIVAFCSGAFAADDKGDCNTV